MAALLSFISDIFLFVLNDVTVRTVCCDCPVPSQHPSLPVSLIPDRTVGVELKEAQTTQ